MNKIQTLKNISEGYQKELLNRIFSDEDKIFKCLTLVTSNDFTKYQRHYKIITEAYINKKNVMLCFEGTGVSVSDFLDSSSGFRQVEKICEDLRETTNIITAHEILERGISELPTENIKAYISNLQSEFITKISNQETTKNDIQSIVNKFEIKKAEYQQKKERGDKLIGTSTGYNKIDEIIDGIRPAHFWVIGGYTNYGKTTFALNIVANLIKQNKRVVFYSLEMEDTDIFAKLLGILSGDSGKSIMKGYAKNNQEVENNIKEIINSKLSIHTGLFELSEILYSMQEEIINNPTTLFVVDFIQNMTVKNSKSEYETVTACALELQQCAKRLKVPIIALSQISNEGARNVSSVMSFKGSGAIASAADLAIEIGINNKTKEEWTEKKMKGEPVPMEIDVRKNRHGKTMLIDMMFDMHTGRFEDTQELIKKELDLKF